MREKTGRISVITPKNGSARMYTSGWPKNQNRCCHSSGPPFSAAKTRAPNRRSASSASNAAARTGKASSTSTLVSRMFQVKIGIRNIVIPGARMQMIVVMKLTAPRIVPKPVSARPMIHMSAPRWLIRTGPLRGV
ncbi:hypothetical protein GCM10018782_39390 [Streptomyces griseoaurantiacus]|nr:hypothetical protein GCM10018782_39390 [Streptomyces griseoaurantiacus]